MAIEINQTQPPPCRSPHAVNGREGAPAFGRLIPLGVILAVMALAVAMGWHRQLSFETLVRHHSAIEELVAAHRAVAILSFIAVYAAAVALSFPGAALLTIAGGAIFGALAGGVAAAMAATLGATSIFLITKYAFSCVAGCGWMRRGAPLAEKLAAGFRKDAFCYLVFLRLVPLFPFWLVNLISAPAGVGLVPFIAATALGILPATFAFAFLGAGLSSAVVAEESAYQTCVAAAGKAGCHLNFDLRAAFTPELIGGLVVLGMIALIPPVARRYGAMRRRAKASRPSLSSPASGAG
ncbi:MAG TPA: VTT domain-containing protein [Xanthobacteraceae bacterium]|jgi:uncharacterized membrane protein YdjX (TVP38/TMEM64 family)|nr:VTT domain-containing protein [Xanthobacteraceae bacterium]